MKIAFDAKRLFHNHTGLGNYSRSLVGNIRALGNEHELFLFAADIENSSYPQFNSGHYSICDGKGRFLWRLKNMVKDIDYLGIDLYHGLSNELPVGISKLAKTKSIVTIHDLIFLRYPEYYPTVDRILYKEKSKRACKIADHIIAVSEATKEDIIHFYKIAPEKISVIYQAYDEALIFQGDSDIEEKKSELRPFILFVGSITERKNLKHLLMALGNIQGSIRPLLKVVGKGGAYEKKMRTLTEKLGLTRDVTFLGHVSNKELKDLYKNANCLVYPSFHEGFGIPIIEALICGTPVITSDVSSMPEAASGLGVLVNPNSVEELSSAIESAQTTQNNLSEKQVGLIFDKFNPKRHAIEVMDLYKKLLKC